MSSLNKAQIIGNIAKEPDVRYTNDNRAVATVNVATSEEWKDKDGHKQSKAEYHRVVVFGKLGEVIEKYLKKGNKVFFEGKLQTRQWTDKNGIERYTTEIVVDSFNGQMIMLGSKPTSANNAQVESQEPDFDDDIPFN